mmetsp:Transcript_18027/g.36380  ORF Transcript_18027/g.36380 Transcript_18027/m.36380 type:complete len:286 (+) Transcript_18027:1175-2032(+)
MSCDLGFVRADGRFDIRPQAILNRCRFRFVRRSNAVQPLILLVAVVVRLLQFYVVIIRTRIVIAIVLGMVSALGVRGEGPPRVSAVLVVIITEVGDVIFSFLLFLLLPIVGDLEEDLLQGGERDAKVSYAEVVTLLQDLEELAEARHLVVRQHHRHLQPVVRGHARAGHQPPHERRDALRLGGGVVLDHEQVVAGAEAVLQEERRAVGLERPVVQDGDAVAEEVRLVHVVSGQDDHPLLLVPLQQLPHLMPAHGVDPRRRLVEEDDAAAPDQRHCDRQPALLSSA